MWPLLTANHGRVLIDEALAWGVLRAQGVCASRDAFGGGPQFRDWGPESLQFPGGETGHGQGVVDPLNLQQPSPSVTRRIRG